IGSRGWPTTGAFASRSRSTAPRGCSNGSASSSATRRPRSRASSKSGGSPARATAATSSCMRAPAARRHGAAGSWTAVPPAASSSGRRSAAIPSPSSAGSAGPGRPRPELPNRLTPPSRRVCLLTAQPAQGTCERAPFEVLQHDRRAAYMQEATQDPTIVSVAADPLAAAAYRAEAWAGEPFLRDGENVAEVLAPGTARRRALDDALAEIDAGRPRPSSQWKVRYALMLGLERVLAEEEPHTATGTGLRRHQVDALAG